MKGQKEVDAVMGRETGDASAPQVENDIYTMPEEFYVPIEVKSRKLLYVIIIFVVLLVVFGGATAYVLLSRETPPVEEMLVIPEIDPIDGVDVITTVEEETTIIDQVEPEAEDTIDIGDPPVEVTPVDEPLISLPTSVDLDGDGLTDIEETLLGVDPALADTDGDGFFDGAELLAGFDPSSVDATLSDSSLFKEYVNEAPSFTVSVPSSWVEKRTLSEQDAIEFIALNKDTVRLTIEGNSSGDSIDEWFTKTFSTRTTNELTRRTVGGRVGRESIIRREVYVPIGAFVLIVEYDVAGKKEIAHPGIFEFILNSITF